MKNILFKISGVLSVVLLLGVMGCEKDELPKLGAEMVTWKKDGITSTSAELSGFVVAQGSGFTEYGVVWGSAENPTVKDALKVADKVEKAAYWVTVDGLEYLTTYHYRAYVKDNAGVITYGKDATFTTLANIPLFNTTTVSDITSTSASILAEVTGDGKAEVTDRGICYGFYNDTIAPIVDKDSPRNGDGIGAYTTILELLPATKYSARAFAINKMGVGYSNEVSFTTLNGVPVLSADSVKAITKVSAEFYGKVIVNGGSAITERGFVIGSNDNPTVSDTKLVNAESTMAAMVDSIKTLADGKKYYLRAFATNATGTGYSNTIEFTTESDLATWYIPGGYVEASYPGSEWVNWNPAKSPFIMNSMADKANIEGYVYMAGANNEWKFASKPSSTWEGPNYGNSGTPGVLSDAPDAGNFSVPAGYYKLNVDMSATPMTYTAVATDWGVIGDATPAGWASSTGLTYDPASQTWRGTVAMTAGEFKFRANDAWDIDYGSSTADNKLNAGGDNIAVTEAGEFDITLDLSNPNEYTYSANRWGLIGDATPGKWGADTDLTWDAAQKVFTVTLDLTVGEIKFRANDAWDVDFGGPLGALVQGGDNIAIAEAGNYTVTLNTMTKVATLTKN